MALAVAILKYFYPRSPCGERPSARPHFSAARIFLSTLSLRRATIAPGILLPPRALFLSTLSLRRATTAAATWRAGMTNFYPRSPCGERPKATDSYMEYRHFYPRSPCGERQLYALSGSTTCCSFLSTLSLRRATKFDFPVRRSPQDFYPRSPCGERRCPRKRAEFLYHISIHALLAESDACIMPGRTVCVTFLSTLSLRRATRRILVPYISHTFLSTLSLRRATFKAGANRTRQSISIHALLAESDRAVPTLQPWHAAILSTLSLRRATRVRCRVGSVRPHFYPRSPCGERPGNASRDRGKIRRFLSTLSLRRATGRVLVDFVVVHILSALLAESD